MQKKRWMAAPIARKRRRPLLLVSRWDLVTSTSRVWRVTWICLVSGMQDYTAATLTSATVPQPSTSAPSCHCSASCYLLLGVCCRLRIRYYLSINLTETVSQNVIIRIHIEWTRSWGISFNICYYMIDSVQYESNWFYLNTAILPIKYYMSSINIGHCSKINS